MKRMIHHCWRDHYRRVLPIYIAILFITGMQGAEYGIPGFPGMESREQGENIPTRSHPAEVPEGFEGCSWKKVVPLDRVTLVHYDENSIVDDLAFLSAVPANVFHSSTTDNIFSNPILFYRTPVADPIKNSYQGLSYFLNDWAECLGDDIDELDTFNIPSNEVEQILDNWPVNANGTGVRAYNNPSIYATAAQIAAQHWTNTDTAVVSLCKPVPEEFEEQFNGTMEGVVPGTFEIDSTHIYNRITAGPSPPQYNNFTIEHPYKYISAYMTWDGLKGKDPDLQLYDWSLGEVATSENWNPIHGAQENTSSIVYNNGPWSAAVTYMPTQSGSSSQDTRVRNGVGAVNYDINITLHPGIEIALPESPYWCRDVEIILEGNASELNLGLAITGPLGECLAINTSGTNNVTIRLNELGEGTYNITVLKMDNDPLDRRFNISYSWKQNKNKQYGHMVSNAVQGAILGSMLNCPLLYCDNTQIDNETYLAITELGCREIILVDTGNEVSAGLVQDLEDEFEQQMTITTISSLEEAYKSIRDISASTDVVFSTLEPWTCWDVEKKPLDQEEGGLFIGPAAFAAAHHGTPLILAENHQALSDAKAWHNAFWQEQWEERNSPSVGDMVLTGKEIFGELDELGFDSVEPQYILTVADQYDIGPGWDRCLLGKGTPGRITGNPMDAALAISRNIFYPVLIYANPAMEPEGIELVNGSSSRRDEFHDIDIYKNEEEEHYNYPVLHSYISYRHRFNERGSRWWGTNYSLTNGMLPYWSPSEREIDRDVNAEYGQEGKYWPDLRMSEVMPFYAQKSGFDSVYSTYFFPSMENLNRGVLLWSLNGHGSARGTGSICFWRGDVETEPNPWRGYETFGSTDEPDSIAMRRDIGTETHVSTGDDDRDGVIISIEEQKHTAKVSGELMDSFLGNLHSCGFITGACKPGNTFFHLSLQRHGSVFQVINPWTSAWYATYAYQMMMSNIALNYSVGEAFRKGMELVGIMYSQEKWWWDILENAILFGDPALKLYTPEFGWEKPDIMNGTEKPDIDGHTPFGHLANIVMGQVEIYPTIPDQGDNIHINFTLANHGLEGSGAFEVDMWLDEELHSSWCVEPMEVDEVITLSHTIEGIKTGDWSNVFMVISADTQNMCRELNENDNVWTSQLHINSIPIPRISCDISLPYTFTNFTFNASSSNDVDGQVVQYLFDPGDGTQTQWIDRDSYDHSYSENGVFDACVRVKDDRGATSGPSEAVRVVVMNRKPVANFTVMCSENTGETLYSTMKLLFDASTAGDMDGNIVNYTWNLDDGVTRYGKMVEHVYEEDGVYRITLVVTDNDGDFSFIERYISINNCIPVCRINVVPGKEGNRSTIFSFEGVVSDRDGEIRKIHWDFGDGEEGEGEKTSHQYAHTGNYKVILSATDNDGGVGRVECEIQVNNIPALLDIGVEEDTKLTFETFYFWGIGHDIDGNNTKLNYTWDMDDGNKKNGPNTSMYFVDDGHHTIICNLMDEEGEVTRETLMVNVLNRAPTAHFTVSDLNISVGDKIKFNADSSTDRDGHIVKYTWNMGDGTEVHGKIIEHTYNNLANCTVVLKVEDDDGAISLFEMKISAKKEQELFLNGWEGGVIIAMGLAIILCGVTGVILFKKREKQGYKKKCARVADKPILPKNIVKFHIQYRMMKTSYEKGVKTDSKK